jgi:hypothetical protein
MDEINKKKPSPSAPPSNEKTVARASKSNLKNMRCPEDIESQKKALQNLDQMVKNIYDTGENEDFLMKEFERHEFSFDLEQVSIEIECMNASIS